MYKDRSEALQCRMIKLFRRSLVRKLPALHLACSKRKQLIGLGASSEIRASYAQLSSVKQPAGHRHKADIQPHQGTRGPASRLSDPIRPVSNKLLLSLMKRHEEKFPPLESKKGSTAVSLDALSTQDLIHAIYNVPKDALHKTDQLKNMERLLTKRLQRMTLEEALHACHGFYLQEYSFHQFLSHMLSMVDERFDGLGPAPSEITRLLFYVFIHGSAPTMLLHRVEEYVLQNLDEFHINDLGVVCVGFFRANSRLCSQDLLDAVAKKLLKDISSLEPFILLDFVKTFRHANYIRVSFYEQLADHLIQNKLISRYTTLNPIMHIAFTYASIPVQHTALLQHLLSHAEQLLNKQWRYLRTKDLSKFVWACGTLQFRPENYEQRYGQLVERFEANAKDNRDFPESIAEMLMGLVYLGIFPQSLLHRCLSSDVTTKLLGSGSDREKSFQLLLLNETVKIECPDYTGNLLSQSQIEALLRYPSVSPDLEMELQTRVGLLAVLCCLRRCLGDGRVQCRHPFIHFRTAVIELWHSKEHGFLSVSPPSSNRQTFSSSQTKDTFIQRTISDNLYSALTKKPVNTSDPCLPVDCKRLAVVVTSSNQFALNDNMRPLGHLHTMMRQLDKAGYIVVEILPEDALKLELSSHEDRCHHLSDVLSSALQTSVSLS